MKRLLLISPLLLTSCTWFVIGGGGVNTAIVSEEHGQGYTDSQLAAMLACSYKDSEREAQPGDGYRESKDAAEDADCHDDK